MKKRPQYPARYPKARQMVKVDIPLLDENGKVTDNSTFYMTMAEAKALHKQLGESVGRER